MSENKYCIHDIYFVYTVIRVKISSQFYETHLKLIFHYMLKRNLQIFTKHLDF